MRISGSKVLLVVLAVVVLALGIVAFRLLSGGGKDVEDSGGEGTRPDARMRETSGAGSAGNSATSAEEERRSERTERRRLRTAEQRRKLIAAIELARVARLEGKTPAGTGSERDSDRGELSKESIRGAVQAVIEDVKTCYDEQLKFAPDLGGKIIVDFTINAEEGVGGVVDHVEVSEKSDEPMRTADQLAACIVETIYTLELPAPEGGGTVDVSYPMVMSPGPSAPE